MNKSDQFSSPAGASGRQGQRADAGQAMGRQDGQRSRPFEGRGRGSSRFRRSRYQRLQGGGGGRSVTSSAERDNLPTTLPDWERKIEAEDHKAFLDFAQCFEGTPIPFTRAMADDLFNPGLAAAQETQAMMLACCKSMDLKVAVEPDGAQGTGL